jgi:two-component system, NtrC family, response regulator HydG
MKPTKLSAHILRDLPPVLAQYVEPGRQQWIEVAPSQGRVQMLGRPGYFQDRSALAIERKQLIHFLGVDRARAVCFRAGFEQGRAAARRHLETFENNPRLALQAGQVFGQVEGRFMLVDTHFEFDLSQCHLHRVIALDQSVEAQAMRPLTELGLRDACWSLTGYFSGHASTILDERVIMLEEECQAAGHENCRLVARLEAEWGDEADWAREALRMEGVEREISVMEEQVVKAERAAHRARGALGSLHRRIRTDLALDALVADSDAMVGVMRRARQTVNSSAPVLIVGQKGTGRHTLAHAIHLGGRRGHQRPFEAVDCGALANGRLARELAGYARGSFKGVARGQTGALVRAHTGTLFLDELAETSLDAQALIMRVLEEGYITPYGSPTMERTDVRIIAATTHEPQELVANGALREDLYLALSAEQIELPPLRVRDTDILRLAQLFVQEFRHRYETAEITLSEEVKQTLLDCSWPGNVRQLRNVIEHAVVFTQGGEIGMNDLPPEVLTARKVKAPRRLSPEVVEAALRRTQGNRGQAAELLGIGRTTLWRMMKKMGLE